MTKSQNGKGKAKAKAKSTSKPKKLGHCDHGKPNNGDKCAKCYMEKIGGKGIRFPCKHGVADNGNRCVLCYESGEGGSGICEHLRRKDRCKQCGGSEICKHGINKQFCKKEGCEGSQICEHKFNKSKCKICNKPGEGHVCEHGRVRSSCKECDGSDYCEHGKQKTKCNQGCGGSQICEHGRHKYQCPDCNGSVICEHMKQKDSCSECNDHHCFCCHIKKTARREAMCYKCLSKVSGTSVEEIHLTSMMCYALYGNSNKLEEVSVKKISEDGTPFDMVFEDISDEGVIVIEHDPSRFHSSDDSLDRDTKKTLFALNNDCIIIRHRHVDCPKIDIENDNFHVIEFNGYSRKEYTEKLLLNIIEYMINMGVLTDFCMENAFQFIENSSELSRVAYDSANEYIRKIVLG